MINTYQSLITRKSHESSAVAVVDKKSATTIRAKIAHRGALTPTLLSFFFMNCMLPNICCENVWTSIRIYQSIIFLLDCTEIRNLVLPTVNHNKVKSVVMVVYIYYMYCVTSDINKYLIWKHWWHWRRKNIMYQ